ncbi:EndoU domain-containing protein [Cellulomonas sp.]|uniref:EndoU domain-containing protein n=1 Tax=Cellulomonas sp. TaxID=40001 RepID=UPI0025848E78|nr:EndoU domain-containing protein [Cellulomonas sp.]MCR6688583.1 EndoU domain-containing protein [Cellulomonas sp.]
MLAAAVATVIVTLGLVGTSSVAVAMTRTTYITPVYVYDAPALWSSPDNVASFTRGPPSVPEAGPWVRPASVRDDGVAANSVDELADLASASRRSHILDGHRYGGEAGNTWFPKGWSDGKIMQSISDIATDPSLTWVQQTGPAGAAFTRGGAPVIYRVDGVRDGVKIRVVLQPGGEGIITGFPIP